MSIPSDQVCRRMQPKSQKEVRQVRGDQHAFAMRAANNAGWQNVRWDGWRTCEIRGTFLEALRGKDFWEKLGWKQKTWPCRSICVSPYLLLQSRYSSVSACVLPLNHVVLASTRTSFGICGQSI